MRNSTCCSPVTVCSLSSMIPYCERAELGTVQTCVQRFPIRRDMIGHPHEKAEDGPVTQVSKAPPPTVKGRDARRRLLEAGKKQFGANGYAGARGRDVTAAAGLSAGGFYRDFK